MSGRRKNAGQGYGMMFHGSFAEKKDAVAKERKTKHAFIRGTPTKHGYRYIVMSPRTNPIKRKKRVTPEEASRYLSYDFAREWSNATPRKRVSLAKKAAMMRKLAARENPSELLVMGANPRNPRLTIEGADSHDFTVPAGTTITIRTNPQPRENLYLGFGPASPKQRKQTGLTLYRRPRAASAPSRTRSGTREPLSSLRADVASALVNQGFPRAKAKRMARSAQGNDFSAMFNDAMRRNPSAEALRERFTGREVGRVKIFTEPHMPAGDYAMLGKGLALYVKPRTGGQVQIIDLHGVTVVSDESARQIYFVGGDQDISAGLSVFGALDRGAGLFEIGEARRIDYKQRKEHVPQPEMDSWRHDFGEETGQKPIVLFDAGSKRLLLEGGAYQIREEGIVN